VRSPLKWPGGKKRVLHHIRSILPFDNITRLIEPFVGGGSVFLNLEATNYLLCDANADLIAFYRAIKKAPAKFKQEASRYFNESNNNQQAYYALRDTFNNSDDPYQRATLLLYLNRHGYNGLCRYNKSGGYNVPFGKYKRPYFPAVELDHLANRIRSAKLVNGDFAKAFDNIQQGDVIYCDPPYSPINRTANFTNYSGTQFSDDDQRRLVECALAAKERGVSTLISNHYTQFTKDLYASADKKKLFSVQRSISQNGQQRTKVKEVLALYQAY
jgi:DNA adenine methylase